MDSAQATFNDKVEDRMNRLHFYVNHMAERGIRPAQILDNTGLHFDTVSHPQFQPTPQQFSAAINNMLQRSDAGIGIEVGLAWNISYFGIFGYALLSCKTMLEIRDLWLRYFPLTTSLLKYESRAVDGEWWIDLKENFPLGRAKAFAVEEHIARIVKTCPSIIDAHDFGIKEIQLSYAPPQHRQLYEKNFGCEIKFNQRCDRLILDAKFLECRLSFANEDVSKTCEQQCMHIVKAMSEQEKLPEKVKRHLIYHYSKHPTLPEMAKIVGLSARSFRRQLKEADTSFQQLLDEVRLDFALQYLQNTNLTPKEICYRVGYSNVSNFRRAMKAWTGKKLSDFRRPVAA
jgi:AraC-like DNA-binding protein